MKTSTFESMHIIMHCALRVHRVAGKGYCKYIYITNKVEDRCRQRQMTHVVPESHGTKQKEIVIFIQQCISHLSILPG